MFLDIIIHFEVEVICPQLNTVHVFFKKDDYKTLKTIRLNNVLIINTCTFIVQYPSYRM